MSYVNGKTYFIVPVGNENIALNLQGVGVITNNRNVNLYTRDSSTDQQWVVDIPSGAGYAYLKCKGDTTFGLDYYYGKSNPGNCDIYKVSGNEDAKINFITVDASQNKYKIQSYRNNTTNNLYLTATSLSANGDVRWQASNDSMNQVWKLIEVENNTQKSLIMPKNVNQWYSRYNYDIRHEGCALCCGVDVSAFYGTSINNNVSYFYTNYWTNGMGYSWEAPMAKFIEYSYSLNKIKSEIDLGRPVIVHARMGSQEHWVVAYKYINSAATSNDIYVLDPYNSDSTSQNGENKTLSSAMLRIGSNYILDRMKITLAK